MDYNDIPVFVRVVETSSFTKAAASLGLQKSSVSRSVLRLEAELGVRLLQRTTRQLGLTDAGQTFYERVRSSLIGFEEAATTVRELGSEPRGTIRVTAPPGAGALGLADAITSFTTLYPSIVIEVDLSARMVDLVSEGFDIALRAGRLADSSLIARKVGTTDLILLAAPSYLKTHGRPRALRDLEQHDCVIFRGRNGRASWEIRTHDGEEIVDVHGPVHSNELEFVLRAAIAGAGIAALPPQHAREAIARGELEVVLAGNHLKGADLHVVLPSSVFVPARVTLLRDHLVRELSAISEAVQRQCNAHGHALRKPTAPNENAVPNRRRRQRQAIRKESRH
ncbi:MAG TPA: LysR family transcriptional regulator [Polyangiales bacterium]|nr:LysR family transcriptional regulator [Polyangiales bacterium]